MTASRGSWILPATITLREVTLGYATKAGWSPCAASSLLTHGRRFGHTVLSLRTRICLVQPGELWLLVSCNEAAPPELRERLRSRFDAKGSANAASAGK